MIFYFLHFVRPANKWSCDGFLFSFIICRIFVLFLCFFNFKFHFSWFIQTIILFFVPFSAVRMCVVCSFAPLWHGGKTARTSPRTTNAYAYLNVYIQTIPTEHNAISYHNAKKKNMTKNFCSWYDFISFDFCYHFSAIHV